MIGSNTEKNFSLKNYEEFYEHHYFEPIPEKFATDIHEVIPRFGWAYDKLEAINPKTLLDLGCLDGSFALTIAKHFGTTVTGVDLTVDGIDLAKERATAQGLTATFHQGKIEIWLESFVNTGQKFDVVTLFEIIEHIEKVPKVLRLIDKVLAPGGHVLVSTPSFEAPTFGMNDEQNKCHIRLYTTKDEDYEAINKYGHTRKATSITSEIGKGRIKEVAVHNELINVLYQ